MIPRIHAHDLVRKSGSKAVIFDMDGVLGQRAHARTRCTPTEPSRAAPAARQR